MSNSWNDELSMSDSEEMDDDDGYYDEEETEEAGAADSSVLPAKKNNKISINVYCTQYDVIKKVAKRCNFRLREIEEDHDGGAVTSKNTNGKLAEWDISWHDMGISADFFAKMQVF